MHKVRRFINKNNKLIIAALFIATIGHLYFIKNQVLGNSYMVGPGDQSSQMIIFKDYLYNQFKSGNFFYSFTYNGGGNFFTRLSYYYSTSMMFFLTACITFILELLNIISEPDIFYWAQNILFVSIIRSTLIIVITTKFIEMFDVKRLIALLGASIYSISIIYFRHTALWEMFSDALIWLPILLIGVEYIIRDKKGTYFTLGVFLTLFNNGYFAFINLVITALYLFIRFFIRLTNNEIDWLSQIKKYIVYGLIGLGLSLPGFIPFALGFFQTSRLTSDINVNFNNFTLSHLGLLLYTDQVIVVPFLFIFMILIISNYKNKKFAFFAILSICMISLRYSPFVGSLMNGFGHPQYRWLYAANLFIALTISIGIKEILSVSNKSKLLINFIIASFLIVVFYYSVQKIYIPTMNNTIVSIMPYLISFQILLLLWGIIYRHKIGKISMVAGSILVYLITVYAGNQQLSYDYNLFSRNQDYYTQNKQNQGDFENVLNIIESDADGFYRVDYSGTANFGLMHSVPTLNNYSSFQNNHQQFFNRFFQIDTIVDSNGIMDGLGGRQNLNALFNVEYIITNSEYNYKVPNNYLLMDSYKQYSIYKNELPLAFIHPVNDLYSIEHIDESTFKDDLVIQGAIVPAAISNIDTNDDSRLRKDLDYSLTFSDVVYQDSKITIVGEQPEIKININEVSEETDTLVIEYTLKPTSKSGNHRYTVNNHLFNLVGYGDQYSSQIFRNEIHLDKDEEIIFSLSPRSNYTFELHAVHETNDNILEKRHQLDSLLDYNLDWEDGKLDIFFNNDLDYNFMVLPLFNETGWQLKVNNEYTEIISSNRGMIGFEIPNGEVQIELLFIQPYFKSSLVIALLSLIALLFLNKTDFLYKRELS